MYNMTAREVYRLSHVTRWHIVRTARPQTVAEHSFNVAALAILICDRACLGEWSKSEKARTAMIAIVFDALSHDAAEARLGDVPTPTKKHIAEGYGHLESETTSALHRARNVAHGAHPAWIGHLVGFCDLLEAAVFLSIEGVGARAREIARDLRIRVEAVLPTLPPHIKESAQTIVAELLEPETR